MTDESDRDLAVKTLREICSDFDAPKQAKATAARTLLELSGDIGKLQSEKPRDTRALHELTREELDAEIARASKSPSKSRPNGAGEPKIHTRSQQIGPRRRTKTERRSAVQKRQKRQKRQIERPKYDF